MTTSNHSYFYLIGVDGGGSGTRVVLADSNGVELARASGGPSGLGLGVELAWAAIEATISRAFGSAGLPFEWHACALGCGLAGVNHAGWLAQFQETAPDGCALVVESDALTTLLGAHGGEPGVIVALGTGSIAASLDEQGQVRITGGYGFPSGDEASGAWLGMRAAVHLQHVLDGRSPPDDWSRALLECTNVVDRDDLVVWLSAANQTAYATLAPTIFQHQRHPLAERLLQEAGREIEKMVRALDPGHIMPVALCGGLAAPLEPYVPETLRVRLREPLSDSATGALQLARRAAAGKSGAAR